MALLFCCRRAEKAEGRKTMTAARFEGDNRSGQPDGTAPAAARTDAAVAADARAADAPAPDEPHEEKMIDEPGYGHGV
jgi:hypothetical protein